VPEIAKEKRHAFEVIEGGPDRDITDHVKEGSVAAKALASMKGAEPSFSVSEFLQGARGAYEMILMGFERGDVDSLIPFLAEDVYQTFVDVIEVRKDKGLQIEAEFIGIRDMTLTDASYDNATGAAQITMNFIAELVSVVRDCEGVIVEGEPGKSRRQRDSWTFERMMGSDDPNWRLVATGE
jgi:predicted lipid-binding transport protein (Tim44 family)